MRIIAAGGGGAEDSRLLDEKFAGWLGVEGRLLYLPVAMDGVARTYHECLAWLESVFAPHGICNITMCTELDACMNRELASFDGIYIGGGNTFRLLEKMRQTGFDRVLLQFARTGGAIYGGSAGAILLGKEIGTSAHRDANEPGLLDLAGLDLLHGYSIWCHFTPEDDHRIDAYVHERYTPVLALSESAGVCRDGGRLYSCGYEAVRVYWDSSLQFIRPGDAISTHQAEQGAFL
jgi:dipeptidase E